MTETVDRVVTRVSEGQVRWEAWWVERHGGQTTPAPTLDACLGFIDQDVVSHGLVGPSRDEDRVRRGPMVRVALAIHIIGYRGFHAMAPA